MLELREDPRYEDVQTSNLMIALEAAMQIQKRKVLVGPSDSVGIMLFNTVSMDNPWSYLVSESGVPTFAITIDKAERERVSRCRHQEGHLCVSAASHHRRAEGDAADAATGRYVT